MLQLKLHERRDTPRKVLEKALEDCEDMDEVIVFMVKRTGANSVRSRHFCTEHTSVVSVLGILELAKQDMVGKID